jgi:hypothetical protein
MLMGILHLGNILFDHPNQSSLSQYGSSSSSKDDSKVQDHELLAQIAKLFGISYELLEDILTVKSKLVGVLLDITG